MIDLTKYPLTYFCKETGKKVRARVKGNNDREIIDPETGEINTYSFYKARMKYIFPKENQRITPDHARPMGRRRITASKAFRDYLNSTAI